ncbi:MAG: BBP7 family outer membrane beta-barrel protein [Pirellulales bacterium]|nr:BBP7 family outer membrane beta-barrel protein [Pirellulales bacterium]
MKAFVIHSIVPMLVLLAASSPLALGAEQAPSPGSTASTPSAAKKTAVEDNYYARRAAKQAERSSSEMGGAMMPDVMPTAGLVPHGAGQGYGVMVPEDSGMDYAQARRAAPRMRHANYSTDGSVVGGGTYEDVGTIYPDGGMSYGGGGEFYGDGYVGDCASCGDGACAGDCGDNCGPRCGNLWSQVCPGATIWVGIDYLSWWGSQANMPPLVTASPPGTPQNLAGELGEPTTEILFGGRKIGGEQLNGGRIQARYWLVPGEFVALEGDFFMLENSVTQFGQQSVFNNVPQANSILARPFFDAVDGQWIAALLAFPDFVDEFGNVIDLSGGVNIVSRSETQGTGVGGRHLMWVNFDQCKRVFGVGGFRYYRFVDRLSIGDSVEPVGGFFAPGTRIDTNDFFGVENDFYGGEVGLNFQTRHDCWTLDILGRVALGNNHQVVTVDGSTVVSDGTDAFVTGEGLLAQPSNIGVHRRDRFAVIPEVQVNLGYQITPNVKARLGYTMIYWFDTLRAGDQVDLNVNLIQGIQPDPAVPTVPFKTADWWLQGINAGMELQF